MLLPDDLHDLVPVVLVSNEEYWLPYVLKSIMGKFSRYVIYDVGSEDKTRDIIDWFIQNEKDRAELFVRYLPMVPKDVQGTFRNSMIVEACAKNYLIVDGDEIWPEATFTQDKIDDLCGWGLTNERIYGVARRIEMNYDLTHRYSKARTHHRFYSRDAFWTGSHPGEVAGIVQNKETELDMPKWKVYHFHNTIRSSTEAKALKRMERKSQKTYHPGELVEFNLLKELPILKTRIENFPVSPVLEKLWDSQ